MKTIYEWYLTLKEPYRKTALRLMFGRHRRVDSLTKAVRCISYMGNHIHGASSWYEVMSNPHYYTMPDYSKYLKK